MTTWRYVNLVFLPGDEALWHEARIRSRDARLTRIEEYVRRKAFACAHNKRNNPRWQCTSEKPCCYCREVKQLCE